MGPTETESGTIPDPLAETVRPNGPTGFTGPDGPFLSDAEIAFLGKPAQASPPAVRENADPPCGACGWPDPGGRRCDLRTGDHAFRVGRRFFLLDLIQGARSLLAGMLDLMHEPTYVGRIGTPIVANVVGVTGAGFLWLGAIWPFFHRLVGLEWGFLEFLKDIGGMVDLSLFLSFMTMLHVAPLVLLAVSSPFLDDIARITERDLCRVGPRENPTGWWHSLWHGTRSMTRMLALQVALLPVSLILSLFGVWLGLVAATIVAFFNASVWFDLPFTRRGYPAAHRMAILRHNWARVLGFGLAFQVVMFLPFVNFILLPGAAVAATRLFYRFGKTVSFKDEPATAEA